MQIFLTYILKKTPTQNIRLNDKFHFKIAKVFLPKVKIPGNWDYQITIFLPWMGERHVTLFPIRRKTWLVVTSDGGLETWSRLETWFYASRSRSQMVRSLSRIMRSWSRSWMMRPRFHHWWLLHVTQLFIVLFLGFLKFVHFYPQFCSHITKTKWQRALSISPVYCFYHKTRKVEYIINQLYHESYIYIKNIKIWQARIICINLRVFQPRQAKK